tara:strand:- start:4467 stop:6638 length:2172 start_codon:yes stop_codon:yes gene_type:complete
MPTPDSTQADARHWVLARAAETATNESLVLLAIALLFGYIGLYAHCFEFQTCTAAHTCWNSTVGSPLAPQCSFSTVVSVVGDRLYNYRNVEATWTALTRGVCAPGERLSQPSAQSAPSCLPAYSFPDALQPELGTANATGLIERHCGAWIDAAHVPMLAPVRWYYGDDAPFQAAAADIAEAEFSNPRIVPGDVAKFHAACTSTLVSGNAALRAAALEAYAYLRAQMAVTDAASAYAAVGVLVSHHCAAPVRLATVVDLRVSAFAGDIFEPGTLARALFGLEEGVALQELAETANGIVNRFAWDSDVVSVGVLWQVIAGALPTTTLDSTTGVRQFVTPELDGFQVLLQNYSLAHAQAYLDGAAAACALTLQSHLDTSVGYVQFSAHQGAATKGGLPVHARPRGVPRHLGRFHVPDTPGPLSPLSSETAEAAMSATWGELYATRDAASLCSGFTKTLFPDRMDAAYFDLLVPAPLYARLEALFETMKSAMQTVFATDLAPWLVDGASSSAAVAEAQLRLPGAPAGSSAAFGTPATSFSLPAGQGPLRTALEQAHGIFAQRLRLSVAPLNASWPMERALCELPLLIDSLARNAYVLRRGNCVFLGLGELVLPAADERYDDASLLARAGWLMAHELAHFSWRFGYTALRDAQLPLYQPSVYDEAFADVAAVLALRVAGLTLDEICAHQAQMWCARMPPLWSMPEDASHPGPNTRATKVCETVQALFS